MKYLIKGFKVHRRRAVAFTGPSGSGKTTIVEKVARILIENNKVAIIKNDPKNKAVFDVEGKDSDKFTKTGAEVVITSPQRTTFFSQRTKTLNDIIEMISDFDILLVEGLKNLPLPRIAIFRNEIDESYFSCSEAIAVDDTIDLTQYVIPSNIDILNLNNDNEIIEWIHNNAKII